MAEQTESREPRVSGEDILTEVMRNLEDGLFPIRYTTLVPSNFRIYLHPGDYEPMAGAIPFLVDEIRQALRERLTEWNSSGKLAQVLGKLGATTKPKREYKTLGGDWTIEFYPDPENRLKRGEIEIYSELGAPAKTEYGVGSMTQRITKRDAVGHQSSREEEMPPTRAIRPANETVATIHANGGGISNFDANATDELTGPIESGQAEPPTARASETVYATLEYEDRSGTHRFEVKRNQVVIGRGGKAYWIDLKLDTLPDVSREHCRLRRDPVTGAWTVKDVSQFGTTVDGVAVPTSIDRADGQERDVNLETPLPDRAKIVLADCITLEFTLLRRV